MDPSCSGETKLRTTIVVAEQGNLWLAALRTCVRRSAVLRVMPEWVHVPSREEITSAISRCGSPVVVLQVTLSSAADDVLQLETWREAFPSACFIAALDWHLGSTRIRDFEAALHEAGAAYVLTSPRRAAETLPLLERHGERLEAANVSARPWHPQLNILSDLPPHWSAGAARE